MAGKQPAGQILEKDESFELLSLIDREGSVHRAFLDRLRWVRFSNDPQVRYRRQRSPSSSCLVRSAFEGLPGAGFETPNKS